MAKVCKRKRKQQLSKLNWLLHRPRKIKKKLHSKAKLNSVDSRVQSKIVNSLAGSRLLGPVLTRTRDLSRKAERFMRCVALSFSYTVSSPINLFCACMSLCCNGFNSSLVAAIEGKEKVHTALSRSMSNGYFQLKKAVGYVGDVIFPSRPYKRKLDEMSDRLEEVESELKKLKRDAMAGQLNQETPSTNLSNVFQTVVAMETANCPPPPVASPPAPPPPPPPPPICKPPAAITFKKMQKVGEGDKKETRKVGVFTLEELTSVKLRKVVREEVMNKENLLSPLTFGLSKRVSRRFGSPRIRQESPSHPFITLKDIKKVSLRKTEINSAKKSQSPGHSKIGFLKTNLRKVHVQRSPGGTPFTNKCKESHGEGLTPIITRALQRKFKLANPPSPIDSFHEINSFFEKSHRYNVVALLDPASDELLDDFMLYFETAWIGIIQIAVIAPETLPGSQ